MGRFRHGSRTTFEADCWHGELHQRGRILFATACHCLPKRPFLQLVAAAPGPQYYRGARVSSFYDHACGALPDVASKMRAHPNWSKPTVVSGMTEQAKKKVAQTTAAVFDKELREDKLCRNSEKKAPSQLFEDEAAEGTDVPKRNFRPRADTEDPTAAELQRRAAAAEALEERSAASLQRSL
ncbi:unnamed protein product [Polarella glacialis]|uniref:Uncharacterized protein n=1 Tax=Polarella glacialis TaxID=89957 RepID=A0A813G746_POLGL|nr:unnamed protein product [Polarella glacialis]